jgi:hypothetical protein
MLLNKTNLLILSVLFLINEPYFISARPNNFGNGHANFGEEFTSPASGSKCLLSENLLWSLFNNFDRLSADNAEAVYTNRSALRPGKENKLISKDRNARFINLAHHTLVLPWILKYYRTARKLNTTSQSFLNKKDIISREENNKLTFYRAHDLLNGKISHDNIEVKKE